MTKEEFMTRLEQSLQDISYDERQSALRYYEEYFEDAGESQDGAVEQLESPEEIAKAIRSDLDIKLQLIRSSVSESKKDKIEDEKKTEHNNSDAVYATSGSNDTAKVIAIVIACILFSPLLLGGAGGAIGIVFGLIGTVVALTLSAGAMIIAGVAVFIGGIVAVFGSPMLGTLLMGTGLLLIGLGCLFAFVASWFWTWALPTFIRWIKKLVKNDKSSAKEASL